ncbi:FN3 associated domain-containing protein [Clostridium estertheticum]|uniref:FN3 associated domain-containing protein n=1 Tax=Clostridium estertheticum TaxID=238834 RepID=UPI001C0D274B|nr:FN3 associated domain-containing protein [Clostridium estertheticum]MBU3187424.1 chitobiase/beta-hexosaminidase C-terminal domain-containing protein [Clostridium estertheticum]
MCSVPLRYEQRACINGNILQLQTHKDFEVRYTTDDSNPKEKGGVYIGEFPMPKTCKFVRTAIMYKGKVVEEKTLQL